MAEFRRVLQVLLNLLGNAIRYSPDHSSIFVHLERSGAPVSYTHLDVYKRQALEWSTAVRLQDRIGLDPVLSPLMQALVASSDAETSALAMQALSLIHI